MRLKKYHLLYVILLLFANSNLYSNTTHTKKEQEIIQLFKLAKDQKNYELDQALQTIINARNLAEQINHDSLIIRSKYYQSLYLGMLSRNEEAKEMILAILPHYRAKQKFMTIGILLNRLGNLEIRLVNYKEAYRYLYEAESILSKHSSKIQLGITKSYFADLFLQQSLFDDALDYAQHALELFKSVNNEQYMAMALTSLGNIHLQIEDYDRAEKHYQQALIQNIKNQQFHILPNIHLGIIAFKKNNLSLAEKHFDTALTTINKLGNFSELPVIYYYQSKIAKSKNNINLAYEKALLAKQVSINNNVLKIEKEVDLILAEINFEKGKTDTAIEYLENTLAFAKENKNYELWQLSANQLSNMYLSKNDYERAYFYRTEDKTAKEIHHNSNIISLVAARSTKNNLEFEQSRELIEQQETINRKSLVQRIMALGLISLALLSFLIFRQYRIRQQANIELLEKNKALNETENILDVYNQELCEKNNELEKYIEANLQLENFAHIASHDLKAPLREQESFIQLLEKDAFLKLNDKEQDYLSIIGKCNSSMQTLIEDMIKYSLIKGDSYSKKSIDAKHIIQKAEYMNRDLIIKENAKVILEELPENILVDSEKMTTVFYNLIQNSLIYRHNTKSPVITIGGRANDNEYLFWIKDNGKGISPQYHEDVFSAFKRLNNDGENIRTGLGLTMVKTVIEKHNGKIWLESNKEEGSTVYFTVAA